MSSTDSGPTLDTEMMFEVFDTIEDRLAELDDYLEIAKTPSACAQALVEITRLVHSLKGMTQAFDIGSFSSVCHTMEDAIAATGSGADALIQAALYTKKLRFLFEEADLR